MINRKTILFPFARVLLFSVPDGQLEYNTTLLDVDLGVELSE